MEDYGEDEYSDDFEDGSGVLEASKPPSLTQIHNDKHRGKSVTTLASTPCPKGKSKVARKSSQKRKGGSFILSKSPAVWPTKKSSSTLSPGAREISACRHSIKRLQSKLADVQRELGECKKENQLLNRIRIRHEKDLDRYQAQEGELPQLLSRHNEEVRVLREHLKRSLHNSQTYQKQMTEYRQEILKLGDQKKRLEEVAARKNLLGREKLSQQLQLATNLLKEKDTKISELERKIELTGKNHVSEVRALVKRNRTLSTEAEELRETSQRVHNKLKEKEKNLDVMNMYTQRLSKASQQAMVTTSVTSNQLVQTHITCPPLKYMAVQISPGSSVSAGFDSLFQEKSTQSDLGLDPNSSNKTLKVISSWQKVVDSQLLSNKAVQTDDKPINNASIQTIELSAVKPLPSNGRGNNGISSSATSTSRQAGSQQNSKLGAVNNSGGTGETSVSNKSRVTGGSSLLGTERSSKLVDSRDGRGVSEVTGPDDGKTIFSEEKRFGLFEEEKRKKEKLLAKLRAIDGVKNPPESQPIQSAATRNSLIDFAHENHLSQSSAEGVGRSSLEALNDQGSSVGRHGITVQATNPQTDHTLKNLEPSTAHAMKGNILPGNRSLQEGGQHDSAITGYTTALSNRVESTKQYLQQEVAAKAEVPGSSLPPNQYPPAPSSHFLQTKVNTISTSSRNSGEILSEVKTDSLIAAKPSSKLEFEVNESQGAGHTNETFFGSGAIISDSGNSKKVSLFAGGQLTKGATNLSSLQSGGNTSTRGNGREDSQKTVSSKLSSHSTSTNSWPDPIQNMHTGKPAYATENDPFGSKYTALIKRSLVDSNEYKPLHGRRAGNAKDRDPSLTSELNVISENHPGSKSPSNQNFKPRRESETYPWEVSIDVQSTEPEVVMKARELSATHKRASRAELMSESGKQPLLPLRPKKTNIEMVMGESIPGSMGVPEPDDLEEVVL